MVWRLRPEGHSALWGDRTERALCVIPDRLGFDMSFPWRSITVIFPPETSAAQPGPGRWWMRRRLRQVMNGNNQGRRQRAEHNENDCWRNSLRWETLYDVFNSFLTIWNSFRSIGSQIVSAAKRQPCWFINTMKEKKVLTHCEIGHKILLQKVGALGSWMGQCWVRRLWEKVSLTVHEDWTEYVWCNPQKKKFFQIQPNEVSSSTYFFFFFFWNTDITMLEQDKTKRFEFLW